MSEMTIEPVFRKRPDKDKYQVRFWSTHSEYEAFVAATDKEGLVMQDVFNTLMSWFVESSKRGELNVREEEWKP